MRIKTSSRSIWTVTKDEPEVHLDSDEDDLFEDKE
jgi:hypothetical protein